MTTLEQLPARIDALTSQVSQLGTEMRVEFSAVRGELAGQGQTLRAEMAGQGKALRAEMAEQGTTLREEMAAQGASLRAEMGAGFGAIRTEIAELATQMRVLHEDVISRIAQLQQGWPPRSRRRPKAT